MKKIVLAAAGLGLVGAAGWSGLWFVGRGQIDARLDAEIQAMAAQGYEISHGARQIGGFPFGYAVRHQDVVVRDHRGITAHLPDLLTEVTADDVDRLVTTLPDKFHLEFTAQAPGEDAPQTMRFDFEVTNGIVVSVGQPGRRQEFTSTADAVLVLTESQATEGTIAIELVKPDQRTTLPDPVSGEKIVSSTKIERVDYAFGSEGSDGAQINFEGSVDAVVMTGASNMWGQAMAAALFTSTEAAANGTYQTGASRFALHTKPAQAGVQGGTFSGSSASSAGTITIEDGRMEIAATSRENRMVLAAEPPFASTEGKPIAWTMRSAEALYGIPITPSDAPVPFTLRFALDQVVPDEVLWGLIDPTGTIGRDPGRLIVDLDGTARLTRALDAVQPQAAPPVEVGNVSVKALDVSALGAGIATRGDVEFLQPVWVPAGNLTITFTNLNEVVGKLTEAGILAPEVRQSIAIMAAIYTRPGTAPGETVADVSLGLDGITVNGQPLGIGR